MAPKSASSLMWHLRKAPEVLRTAEITGNQGQRKKPKTRNYSDKSEINILPNNTSSKVLASSSIATEEKSQESAAASITSL